MKTSRRGFIRSIAAGMAAVAVTTRLARADITTFDALIVDRYEGFQFYVHRTGGSDGAVAVDWQIVDGDTMTIVDEASGQQVGPVTVFRVA